MYSIVVIIGTISKYLRHVAIPAINAVVERKGGYAYIEDVTSRDNHLLMTAG